MGRTIAKIFSYAGHPVFLAFYGLWIGVQYHYVISSRLNPRSELFFLIIFFLSLVLVPTLGLMLLLRKYKPSELAKMNGAERRVSLLVMTVLYLFMAFSFNTLFIEPILRVYLMSIGICTAVGFVITRFRTVSLHMLAWGGITPFLILLSGFSVSNMDGIVIGSVIFAGLIGVSRLTLKAHRPSELYLGYSTGFLATAICYLFYYGIQ